MVKFYTLYNLLISGDYVAVRKSQRIKDIQTKKIKESSSSEQQNSTSSNGTKKRRRLSQSQRNTKRNRKN